MAIRKFRLAGMVTSMSASAKIVINGNLVFNGPLSINNSPDLYIAEGEVDLDDVLPTTASVSIEATGGEFAVGMLSWNFSPESNPLLNETERSYIGLPADQIPGEIRDSVRTKGGFYTRKETDFGFGDDPVETSENRSNIQMNGNALTVSQGLHIGIMLGDILSFQTSVFAR